MLGIINLVTTITPMNNVHLLIKKKNLEKHSCTVWWNKKKKGQPYACSPPFLDQVL